MPEVLISEIRVNPAERQREELGSMESLAKSIAEYGLLEPVLLDAEKNLVAGFRRLMAHIALGRDTIKAEYLGAIDPVRAQEIELEENIQRHQLTWQEEAKAVTRIHKMKMTRDPMWTADKTAEALDMSRRKVFNSLELATAVDVHPDVAKADTQAGAMMRLGQIKQLEQRKEDAKVRVLGQSLGLRPIIDVKVVCGKAVETLAGLEEQSFDFAVTNPPYAVDIESVFVGERTIYEDSPDNIVPMLFEMAKEVFRVLRDNRWFVMFYPTVRLDEGKQILLNAGFRIVDQKPCVWYKPNKFMSALSNPYQQFSSQYETFIWAAKGQPRFNKLRLGNVWVFDTPDKSDRIHPLQMPTELWKEILEVGSVHGERIIEPFAGSGSCGVACVQADRSYVGIELSPEYAERANAWINEVMNGIDASTSATNALASESANLGTFDDLKALDFKE